MDWKNFIETDPGKLGGKPVVKGTRLSVEFLLGLRGAGWSDSQILENYPNLSQDSLQAVYAFSSECLREETAFAISTASR